MLSQQRKIIEEAFRQVDRTAFVPPAIREFAVHDRALPIGYGQTISQPTTVRLMLEWLDVRPGHTVLDVGSGSGWTTALLSHLVGKGGFVYAVEIVEPLLEMGERNCSDYGVKNVLFSSPDKAGGLAQHAPYNRILVSASADSVPESLLEQTKSGGKMVIPVLDEILEMSKSSRGWKIIRHPGFVFVPYLTENIG